MLYKSTQQSRESWLRFCLKLQPFDVVCGGEVISKREAFERLYCEDDLSQVSLLMSNIHSEYLLREREAYKGIALRQQHLIEVTDEVLDEIAVAILRDKGLPASFEETVQMMRTGMNHVLECHRDIERTIKEKVGN